MLEIILTTNGVRTTVHGTQSTGYLSEEVNMSSKFEFKVNYTDESFNNVFAKLTRVMVYDTTPNEVVFEGYVTSVIPKSTQDGEISKEVSCMHILSRLNDAVVVGFENASGDVKVMVQRLLSVYNATAKEEDQIDLGTCPTSGGHPDVLHIFSATCWDALTQIVVTDAGWSFRARYYQDKWYLDIADDFGEISDTDLIYGVNLVEISQEINSADLYTRIIPIGGASYIPDAYVNPDMSTLHNPEGMPLTLYNYFNGEPSRIYVANAALEAKYPIIAKIVQYEDIVATDDTDFHTAQGSLYTRAASDAAKLTDIIEGYSANALDLARAGYNFSLIELNKMYHIVNNKLGIDTYLQVTSKKTKYDNPAKCDLTFGKVGLRSSKWMSRKGKSTDQKINAIGSTSYKTTDTRMGGLSMRNKSKSEYDGSTHDANTLYTVSDAGTGKVELYLGDTKISGEEGGGVEVTNAALFDSANLHDYVTTTELMMDVSANTKLYYGANNRMIVAQGIPCYLGSFNASDFTAKLDSLLTANSAYISPEYTGLISYRYASSVVYRYEVDVKVYPYQVNTESSGRWRWWWMSKVTIKETNMSTSAVTTTTYTQAHNNCYLSNFDDISEYGLLLTSSNFGAGSPNALLDSYITNGYVGGNININSSSAPTTSNHVRGLIVFKNADQDAWCVEYDGDVFIQAQFNTRVGAYMPLTAAETCFALGTTQRSEPVTPGGGS